MLNTDLRPLGAGEMLDRAITLYVRWFAPIVTVLAVVVVPLAICEALLAPQDAHALDGVARVLISGGSSASRQATQELARSDAAGPLAAVFVTLSLVVRLLMWCALLSVVASKYAGARASLADAYRLALRRWFPQLVVSLAFAILGTFASIPIIILYLLVVVAVIGFGALHVTALSIGAGIVGGVLVLAAACVIGPLIFMCYVLAAVALVTETASPIRAITIGLRRGLAPGMKRRSIVAGLIMLVVSEAGMLPIFGVGAALSALTHLSVLYFAAVATGTVLVEGLLAPFVVIYATDVRVRREGYDLVVAITDPA